MNETELLHAEAPTMEGLSAITKAEIDIQIATAKRFPRVLSKVKADMLSFATLDEETAQACFYTLKRKDKNGATKLIQGPSIRLAEIAASSFGNIRSGARVVSNDGKVVVCQGVCHDLERNVFFSMETTRRITTKEGRTYSDDMQVTTANAGCAIALRNAITKTVPLALIKPVLEEAKRVAVGDVKSLAAKREKVVSKLKAMGASEENILAAVEAKKIEDIDLTKLETLIGLGTALKDGETTLEEAFPTPTVAAKPQEQTKAQASSESSPQTTMPATPTTEPASDLPSEESVQQKLLTIAKEAGFGFAELVETAVRFGWIDAPIDNIEQFPPKQAAIFVKTPKRLVDALSEGRAK